MLTPEEQAQQDLMITHLKAAVALGYQMATPGGGTHGEAVRAAFPDLFATVDEAAGVDISDELELDDHPMVSRGNEGCFVQTWTYVEYPEPRDDEEEDC